VLKYVKLTFLVWLIHNDLLILPLQIDKQIHSLKKQRILSVDIFRGLTIAFMILVNNPGTWSRIYPPLEHAAWHGITPTDLIFPFFLFIVGTSIVLAYNKKRSYVNHHLYKKIIIRSLKIILIGLFLAGFTYHFPFFKNLSELRLPGVLQRIGIVFLITASFFVAVKNWKWYLLVLVLLLGGYWYAMTHVSIDGKPPQLTKSENLASVIDRKVLGEKHMWKHYEENGYVQGDYDPEGLFSTLPAIGTTILGIFLGLILIDRRFSPYAKVILFVFIGLLLFILGLLWNESFPLNKRLWTSSYVLYTGGLAFLVFALVYLIVDIFNKQKWADVFKYLGMNAIAIFTLSGFIEKSFYLLHFPGSKRRIHSWLYHNLFVNPLGNSELTSMLYAISIVLFYIFVAWWLYRKKIFIKV